MLRKIVQGFALVGVVLGVGAVGAGCLDRPVVANAPTIKTNFTSAVNQSGIDKVDILFDIDNSASMGDKQAYLVQAIPQMIARLVTPQCVTAAGVAIPGQNASPTTGQCAMGAPEFTAVHNMHIGVVTSSLGSRDGILTGSEKTCDPSVMVGPTGAQFSAHNDDQGHLINRTGPLGGGPPIAGDALSEGGGFLYWFPSLGNTGATAVAPPSTPYTTIGTASASGAPNGTLVGDFTEIVNGVGESGCGIESQLESWYRFLIQPDPYAQIGTTTSANGPIAQWQGVDTTILQQRHDFLRPDSLVAIIVLSDENDSEIDVRSYQGTGYNFMSETYPPPRASSACMAAADGPNSPGCAPCTAANASDSSCMLGSTYPGGTDNEWGWDLNLRHVHMPQKYALDPQFPLTRYYYGLTSQKVPNRMGEYPSATSGYVGTQNCTNPLFASALPTGEGIADAAAVTPAEISTTLCNLPAGAARTAGDVFYAHIGGVPHQLLQAVPGQADAEGVIECPAGTAQADCPQKSALTSDDWTKILGKSAAAYVPGADGVTFPSVSYDYTGIDPHMIESMSPRNLLPAVQVPASNPAVSTLSGPTFTTSPSPDPVNGREWTTNVGYHSLGVDREYACIFQLPAASQRDCAALDPTSIEYNSCDCIPKPGPAATGNTSDEVPPLCAKTSTDGTITSKVSDYTVQVSAKAYPTIRELTLANMMGSQGIVSSLCPIHTEDATGSDPLYGYRPAVNAIVDRLKSALGAQCVPALNAGTVLTDAGPVQEIPCLVLVSFAPGTGPKSPTTCSSLPGYSNVDPTLLNNFNAEQSAAAGEAGAAVDLSKDVTCSLDQIIVPAGSTCQNNAVPGQPANGWCYVTGAGVGGGSTCSQAIVYSSNTLVPIGATINLQCVAENTAADAGPSTTKD